MRASAFLLVLSVALAEVTVQNEESLPDAPEEATETLETPTAAEFDLKSCHLAPDPGSCTAELVRFFYDPRSKRCRQFIYGGCLGNENRFESEIECIDACQPREMPPNDVEAPQPESLTKDYLTLLNGTGETSFTFSAEYPFIQLKAVDISKFELRCFILLFTSNCQSPVFMLLTGKREKSTSNSGRPRRKGCFSIRHYATRQPMSLSTSCTFCSRAAN